MRESSSSRNPPERCPRPLYSRDPTQEHHEIPQTRPLYSRDPTQEHHEIPQTRPLYSQDPTQEDLTVPHHDQGEEPKDTKPEVKEEEDDTSGEELRYIKAEFKKEEEEEEETLVSGDQQSMEEEEMMMKSEQVQWSLRMDTNGSSKRNPPERCPRPLGSTQEDLTVLQHSRSGILGDNHIVVVKEEYREQDEEYGVMEDLSEEHTDLCKDVMMEPCSSRNPPERCPRPLYSRDPTQEDLTVPHHGQDEELEDIRVEVKEEEDDTLGEEIEAIKAEFKEEEEETLVSGAQSMEEGEMNPTWSLHIEPDLYCERVSPRRRRRGPPPFERSLAGDRMEDCRLSTFCTEAFIRQVRDRPCIYDQRNPHYKNRGRRSNAWAQIASKIWPDWKTFTPTMKDAKVEALRTKWRSLKDSYSKELKRQKKESRSGSGARRRQAYVHFGILSFLKPVLELRGTVSNWDKEPPQMESAQGQSPAMAASPGPSPYTPPVQEEAGGGEEAGLRGNSCADYSTAEGPSADGSVPRPEPGTSSSSSSTFHEPPPAARRPRPGRKNQSEDLVDAVRLFMSKMAESESPHRAVALGLAPLLQQVPHQHLPSCMADLTALIREYQRGIPVVTITRQSSGPQPLAPLP